MLRIDSRSSGRLVTEAHCRLTEESPRDQEAGPGRPFSMVPQCPDLGDAFRCVQSSKIQGWPRALGRAASPSVVFWRNKCVMGSGLELRSWAQEREERLRASESGIRSLPALGLGEHCEGLGSCRKQVSLRRRRQGRCGAFVTGSCPLQHC